MKVFFLLLAAANTCLAVGCAGSLAGSEAGRVDANSVPVAEIEVVLEQLKKQTTELKSYSSQIEYRFIQPLLESETLRKGILYYQRSDGKSALRINFQTLKQDDEEEQKYIEQYIFDGVWLTHIDYQIKEVKRYQKAEPDEPVDAFELVSENFPIIGFSKVEELKKEFEIGLVEQQGGEAEDFVHLHLKVKADSIYKDDYTSIDFWIAKELYLPAKIVAVTTEEDIYEIKFLESKVNEKIDDKVFELKVPEGFNVETEPLKKSQTELRKAFLDINAILDTWQRNYGNIKSMQVSYIEEVLEKKPSTSNPNILDNLVMLTHLERVEEGNRYHARYSLAQDGFAKPENVFEYAFDGSITKEYVGIHKSGTIQSGQTAKGIEVRNILKKYMLLDIDMLCKKNSSGIYWEQQDPNELPRFGEIFRWASIKKFKVTMLPELETVAGKLCHVIEITNKDGILLDKIWVAHECGMLPLKYYDNLNGRPNVIEVEQVAESASSGIWYPVKAYRIQDTESFGYIKYELTVHSFVPNVKTDDNTFRFDFPKGTCVFDQVKGIDYMAGGEDRK